MANELEKIYRLLMNHEVESFVPQDATLVIKLRSAVKLRDLKEATGFAFLQSIKDEYGNQYSNNSWPDSVSGGSLVTVTTLPREQDLFVGESLDDLLESLDSASCIEPNEYLLLATSSHDPVAYWSGGSEKNATIDAYLAAQELVRILRKYADHFSELKSPRVISVFGVERVDISESYRSEALGSPFPIKQLQDFLFSEHLSVLRIETLKGTICDFLQHHEMERRLPRLLSEQGGREFIQRLTRNFLISQTDYRLDRRLVVARQEYTEFSEQVSKMILGLEAKALAIPAALFVSARLLNLETPFSIQNMAILIGNLLLVVITLLGVISNKSIADSLKKDIEDALDSHAGALDDQVISEKFKKLCHRLSMAKSAKIAIFAASILIFLVSLYFVLFSDAGRGCD